MVYFLLSLIQNKPQRIYETYIFSKPSHKAIYIQIPIKVNILAKHKVLTIQKIGQGSKESKIV